MAGWGALLALVPHTLHHMGPLAGAALAAEAGGEAPVRGGRRDRLASFPAAAATAIQQLVRTAVALAVFAAAYTVSSLVTG
jgi:hypothetical protein